MRPLMLLPATEQASPPAKAMDIPMWLCFPGCHGLPRRWKSRLQKSTCLSGSCRQGDPSVAA